MKLLILFLSLNIKLFAINSCEDKLQNKLWPLDCFIALSVKKEPKNSKAYKLLDNWCELYEDSLVINEPPDALFSLHLPSKCHKLALKTKKHHQGLKLLTGSFLNSFL